MGEAADSPDDRSRHERVKQIFIDALDLDPGRRVAFVAAACGGDEQLQRQVLELLVLHGAVDPVLDSPLDGASALAGLSEPSGAWIGPYRLVRELGRGSMGVVHLAEFEGRSYAVKLLVAGAVSPEVRERFRLEGEILDRLDHEGIARMIDVGGVIGAGGIPQPWIAMEYVDGVSLLEYADQVSLSLDARIELLARVCDAVQHAHERGIVHRDLKPANILVRADGRPVVLDFGVARLTAGDHRPTELATRTGQLLGTPQYMSPEQVQADPAGIAPASDVYSLGMIAYELFSGRVPYDASSLSLVEAMGIILYTEPPPLGRQDARFRGAVERVVAKALEKKPADRYRAAGELALDLHRILDRRPVHAPGPSLWRMLSRWTRTQRRLVAAVLALLGVALLAVTWILGRRRQEIPRETILAAYHEAETVVQQAIPLLYEGERTPSRMRQAIDLYTQARLRIGQVPPLRTHDRLLRVIEKDLGTAQLVLGELTWDLQPYRAAAITLEHAATLAGDSPAGWQEDVQLRQSGIAAVPQRDLDGLLTGAYLGQYRLWGESNALQSAQTWMRVSRVDLRRECGAPRPAWGKADASNWSVWAFYYNSLAEVTTEAARFRADTVLARSSVLCSDSAIARRSAFLQNWPALGSLLFERGRAFRTVGSLTGSAAAFDSSARYLYACADFRGPERPWVFAQTRQELACLALDRSRREADAARRAALLHRARRDVDSALHVLQPTELPVAASASLRSLDAELLAEMAMATHRPALLAEAESELREASQAFPSTGLPREAAWVCIRQAVLARARFGETARVRDLGDGDAALDRAQVLMESHTDSLVLFRIRSERAALSRVRGAAGP
jgi:serine/threonine protein kinase